MLMLDIESDRVLDPLRLYPAILEFFAMLKALLKLGEAGWDGREFRAHAGNGGIALNFRRHRDGAPPGGSCGRHVLGAAAEVPRFVEIDSEMGKNWWGSRDLGPQHTPKTLASSDRNVSKSVCFRTVCSTLGNPYGHRLEGIRLRRVLDV